MGPLLQATFRYKCNLCLQVVIRWRPYERLKSRGQRLRLQGLELGVLADSGFEVWSAEFGVRLQGYFIHSAGMALIKDGLQGFPNP